MKLLVLAPCLPCPPDHGRSKRMFYLYRPLADKHEVWWVSPHESDTESDLHQTERMFAKVLAVPITPRFSKAPGPGVKLRESGDRIGRYLGHPFPVYDKVCEALSCLLDGSFDAVVVDHEMMAGYIRHAAKDTPWLLNTHNVPSVLARRVWPHMHSLRYRFLAWLEYRSVLKFEADTFPMFDAVVAVSETERCLLAKRFGNVASFCVPNGVSSDLAQMHVPSEPSAKVLNFTGTFNYRPNRDAVKFFCSAVFPKILRRDGRVELQLVGKDSDSFARSLPPSLPVSGLGYVSDALEPLAKCTAVIAPFRLGAGTRIKILEAIALGKPVVATTVGAEGIELDETCGLLRADEPLDFAEKVLRALNDPAIRDAAQRTGRPKVLRNYSWESSAGKLARLIDLVARADSGSA